MFISTITVITVHQAIPIIMGANIGTSVTNTIVSFTQIANKNEFRRAFAGATVHDMFNWLSVIVLFTVEIISSKWNCISIIQRINAKLIIIWLTDSIFGIGYLEWLSGEIVKGVTESSGKDEIRLLKVITDPFVEKIIQVGRRILCLSQASI